MAFNYRLLLMFVHIDDDVILSWRKELLLFQRQNQSSQIYFKFWQVDSLTELHVLECTIALVSFADNNKE